MTPNIPQITDSEWLIMKVLWDKSPLLSREIIQSISEKSQWSSKTIETLLRRLVDKGAVGYKNINSKTREYFPLVSQEECIRDENETFLKKLYDGSISMMMSCFLKHQKVTKEELAELRKLLEEQKE
ncbi:MAG: BlaI/MecI/CopY family transcriptional regulator [Bacillota bacterium]